MKVKNIAISVAQVGAKCVAGVASAPFLYAGVAATVVKGVAEITQTVSFKAVGEITEQFVIINNKLEAMRVKEADIVESPVGDEAVAVN
jgi:hypothetical protein